LALSIIFLLTSIFITIIQAKSDDFLTTYEYATMLYFEPRGISCAKCHGETGRRVDNIRYTRHYPENKKKPTRRIIKIKPIYNIGLEKFNIAVKSKNQRFMPTYKLSSPEIRLIHFYLQKSNGLFKPQRKTRQNLKNIKNTQ
jgi:hypothetical protein